MENMHDKSRNLPDPDIFTFDKAEAVPGPGAYRVEASAGPKKKSKFVGVHNPAVIMALQEMVFKIMIYAVLHLRIIPTIKERDCAVQLRNITYAHTHTY